MSRPAKTVLIVEPNESVTLPYTVLRHSFQCIRVTSVSSALRSLSETVPDLFFVSASFAPSMQVQLLEAFKNSFSDHIIPLVWVIDLSQPISHIPGTVWGNKLAIIHSRQTAAAIKELLKPLLH